jgi:hypothetical protein
MAQKKKKEKAANMRAKKRAVVATARAQKRHNLKKRRAKAKEAGGNWKRARTYGASAAAEPATGNVYQRQYNTPKRGPVEMMDENVDLQCKVTESTAPSTCL